MLSIILILIAWFVSMPLWLSILITVVCSLAFLAQTTLSIARVLSDNL